MIAGVVRFDVDDDLANARPFRLNACPDVLGDSVRLVDANRGIDLDVDVHVPGLVERAIGSRPLALTRKNHYLE